MDKTQSFFLVNLGVKNCVNFVETSYGFRTFHMLLIDSGLCLLFAFFRTLFVGYLYDCSQTGLFQRANANFLLFSQLVEIQCFMLLIRNHVPGFRFLGTALANNCLIV